MNEVERVLDEFSRRFKPEPEEELLGAVHALILKCFKQPLTPDDKVPSCLATTIDRVCRKFFTVDPGGNNRKHLIFVRKYKESFEKDFLPDKNKDQYNFPSTLTELLYRLKSWKYFLQYRVGSRNQINLKLERLSPYLIRFKSFDVEIPGQYIRDEEPNVDRNVILQRFEPEVQVHHSHGFSHRRIGLRGNDGNVAYFLVQYSISHITRSDERMMQLYVLLNRMMMKYKETRKRNLVYHVPLVIPLTHRLRLMETHEAHVSFEEVYEQSCSIRGVDSDKPLLLYRDIVRKADQCERNSMARLKVLTDVSNNVIPDYILSRFLHRSLPQHDQLWALKKEFGAQLALCGFLSYIMKIGDRALHKMSFFRHSGRIINSEFYPAYNENCTVECHEPVPFRLTRNLTTFLTPFVVDGVFSSVLTAANSCLLINQEVLKNYLCLFIRDDLLSWNSTKVPLASDLEQRQLEANLREKIQKNVNLVLKRIHLLMPASPDKSGKPAVMNHKVQQLVKLATSKRKLCMMNPTWAPWF